MRKLSVNVPKERLNQRHTAWRENRARGFIAFMNQRRSLFVIFFCSLLAPGHLLAQTPSPTPTFVTGQAAHNVIGQQNFSDITGDTTQYRWGGISGIAIAGNKLIVADTSYLAPPDNSRVLIYNNLQALKNRLPQSDLPPADIVLGEPDFQTATGGTTAQLFSEPVGVASDGTRLFISEWLNNRVLIYNRIPTASQAAADVVVGQTSSVPTPLATARSRCGGRTASRRMASDCTLPTA